ncbi:MAG: hypothetical protein CFE32_19650 [Alphaproteobacteria bacterium PA3]|nr:MAG: hypothetical protein CFE32_19650 [Alphaproteobacteria bacterium PA3]
MLQFTSGQEIITGPRNIRTVEPFVLKILSLAENLQADFLPPHGKAIRMHIVEIFIKQLVVTSAISSAAIAIAVILTKEEPPVVIN